MAILQVHQAKALKEMHEDSSDPGLMQELRTATDLALRATKVTARSLGKAMSTMVVQERHLWLDLAEMKDVDKARFLDAPISQAGLFGDTVEGFAQQFSTVQKQTEAIQHILPRRIYVDRTRSFRSSEQLFVCYRGQQKGKAVSKQRLAHWIVDAIALAYQSQGEPCPMGVRAHSTRSVASSYALVHGASLADICRAAGWATRTPSRDSTVSALSQFLPVCWVTGKWREELAGVTLAVPFPLTRGYERLFSPPVQFPGRRTLVESSSTPGSQTGRSSLTPGPVLVLARPGSPVSPCTRLGVRMALIPFG